MEKRRVKLNINGVVCGLITAESDEYMEELSKELGDIMKKMLAASPFITREAAALTVALNYCDEARKSEQRMLQMRKKVQEVEKTALEIERQSVMLKKENAQLWEETEALLSQTEKADERAERTALQQRIVELETENRVLKGNGQMQSPGDAIKPSLHNPLRHHEYDQQGFVSFFEKADDADET